jgi:hypothetical protein
VLPFTKRAARSDEPSELINSGDLPVGDAPVVSRGSLPPPPASRPRVFARSSPGDEEMTTLMPRKGMTFSARPSAPVTPDPMPKLTTSRPPRPMLEEPPTRQFVMPSAPPPSVSPVAGPARPSPAPIGVQHGRASLKPQPVPGAATGTKSDPQIDPPATVITARTRIIAARPTMSWAAALIAMGVFVGLVTAVVARGDADTLIDAAASFVDPSGTHAAAGSIEVSSVQTKAEEPPTTLGAGLDTLLPAAPAIPVVAVPEPAASPLPPRPAPAPVAYAAPVRRAWHPARPVAHEERVAAITAPKPAAAPKAANKVKATDDDVESASAADALAKAQLEASLR